MRELARQAVQAALDRGATYADARVVHTQTQSLTVRNGIPEAITAADDNGIGVRVLMDGCWGFAGTAHLERTEVDRITDVAVSIARASALVRQRPVQLAPVEIIKTSWRTPVKTDPWNVGFEEKIGVLTDATTTMVKVKGVRVASGAMDFWKTTKLFVSREGAEIEQVVMESGGGIGATAVGEGEVQRRTYPASERGHFGHRGIRGHCRAPLSRPR